MLIRYFNAEIQIVSLVNFTLLSQRSFVPSLETVTKSAVVGHFLSLREPTITTLSNSRDHFNIHELEMQYCPTHLHEGS